MPSDHAWTGIATAQLFELAYTVVAAAPPSTPTTPMTASRIDQSIAQAHDGTLTLTSWQKRSLPQTTLYSLR